MVAAPAVMYIYVLGFHNDPEKFALATDMFRLTIPYSVVYVPADGHLPAVF